LGDGRPNLNCGYAREREAGVPADRIELVHARLIGLVAQDGHRVVGRLQHGKLTG